jgi:diguanylate cyclase (GGDEF)-like protein/PAS domain S-box-containing protein
MAQTGNTKNTTQLEAAAEGTHDRAEAPPAAGDDPLRRFSALSGDWFWVQDAQLRLTYMSSRLAEPSGIDLALYLGARRWDQPALNLSQTDWDHHRAQVERHEPFKDFEIQCLADGGRTVWLSLSAQPLLDEEGGFSGYLGVGRDVTQQKRIEQLRQLEHAVARAVAEAANVVESVRAMLRVIGESEGWDCADFWRVDESANLLRPLERWSAGDIDAASRPRSRAPDAPLKPGAELAGAVWQAGQPVWIPDATRDARAAATLAPEETGLHASVLVPVMHSGRVAGVIDLAGRSVRAPEPLFLETLEMIGLHLGPRLERASLEQARRDSDARLHSLTQLSADWYWELDADHSFTRIEGRNVAGGDKELGRRLIGIRRWESGMEIEGGWDVHRALLEARKPFYEVLVWRPMADGRTRYMSISGEPVFGADGSFTGYHGVGRDVTLQKRAENMLRLEHEVARSLAAAEDTASGLKAVIVALCEAESWDAGRYYRVDSASGQLHFQDGWCVNEPSLDHFIERSRQVWQSGKAVWSSDLPAVAPQPRPLDASARPFGALGTAQGIFAFGVVSGGKTIGVLVFSGRGVRAPDERLQQASRVIGSQVGQFLQRKRAEESLRESEARFRSLTQMSSDFFWETDTQHRVAAIVHGPTYPSADIGYGVVGKAIWELPSVSPDEAGWAAHRATLESHIPFRDFEFARAMPDGMTRYFLVSGEPRLGPDGTFLGYRGVGRDVTESALTRERIASLAYRDPLTGLANRTSLAPALEQAVERARRRAVRLAGVFIDLDGFKQVNDLYGHDAGDRFLIEIARRLRTTVRASDVVARLGGDEFFVLLEEVQDEGAVENVIKKLLSEAVRPYELPGGAAARLSASMGVSLFPDHALDADSLVKLADTAMYAAKQAGKNRYHFFSSGPDPASATADAAVRSASPPAPRPLPPSPEGQ